MYECMNEQTGSASQGESFDVLSDAQGFVISTFYVIREVDLTGGMVSELPGRPKVTGFDPVNVPGLGTLYLNSPPVSPFR